MLSRCFRDVSWTLQECFKDTSGIKDATLMIQGCFRVIFWLCIIQINHVLIFTNLLNMTWHEVQQPMVLHLHFILSLHIIHVTNLNKFYLNFRALPNILVWAACVRCYGTKCPLLTVFFLSLLLPSLLNVAWPEQRVYPAQTWERGPQSALAEIY